MAYLLACWKSGTPYGVRASTDSFELIPLDSETALGKVFSHPYRSGAQKILSWIQQNDHVLNREELSIQDCARFQR
jgi:hypothetical protein